MYLNNYLPELSNLLKKRTVTVHPTLPKSINIGTESFYYEMYESKLEKYSSRFVYEEEGVFGTKGTDDIFALEIKVNYFNNSLQLKIIHYDNVNGNVKIDPVTHRACSERYKSSYIMSEEEHFQLSTVQDILPYDIHTQVVELIEFCKLEHKKCILNQMMNK